MRARGRDSGVRDSFQNARPAAAGRSAFWGLGLRRRLAHRPARRHRRLMDWAHHEPQFRFDIRAEREECERLSLHQAKVLQDRMVRRSRIGRTKHPATPEWEKVYQTAAQER